MQTIKDYLDKTKRTQYVNEDVLSELKVGKIQEGMVFFKPDNYVTCKELEKEFKQRNLVPVDLASLCQYDIDNPGRMDEMKYVGTQWKNKDGKFCYASFSRWSDERGVSVNQDGNDWDDGWWFAGVGKYSELDPQTPALKPLDFALEQAIETVKKAGFKVIKEM